MLGWTRKAVDDWAAKQAEPVSRAVIDAAYAACVDAWICAANTPDAELYALHVARREDIYRRAMAAGDLALAHKVLVDQARLQQQYRTEQRQAAAEADASEIADRIRARGKPALTTVRGGRHG